MRLRKYVGPDLPTVLRRIRRELGEDAVILRTEEKVEGGLLGFFGTRVVEVLAASDPVELSNVKRGLDLSLPGETPAFRAHGGEEGNRSLEECGGARIGDAQFLPSDGGYCLSRETRDFLPLAIARREGGMPCRALFFGPPGSGKTSALGRLAWYLSARRRVLLVSVEEEGRLSGTSRWKAFWEVLGVEYRPVKGFEGLLGMEIDGEGPLLVDTPPLRKDDMGKIGRACREFSMVPFLAVDATMDFGEFRFLLENCRGLEGLRVVVCKMDAVSLGSRRSRWTNELLGTKSYFSDHPSINVPLKPLVVNMPSRCEAMEATETIS